ncbi:mannosyl-3-phosphoglycerate phosphatase-related protein [Pantoea sp. B65]|uniref:mannosyl-3-phosphoglycerate phosphatase-related protein n=1 Tax=Pantoea sp. B65 TaxID=2813359 RepID=UPI0039B49A57
MPSLHDSLMIVTDLDGSLLDHHTYSWQPAQSWLEKLQQHQIPLVICSSKTASEIIPLQQQLGFSAAPFIAENGALVQLDRADGEVIRHHAGKDYSEICHCLRRLRQQYQFRFSGFADFTDQEVAEITGLTVRNAALARRREASESLVWRDSDQQFAAFRQALDQQGLALTQGGRFWHVMARGSGKGAALAWLLQQYPQQYITIGLGDGPNDAPMLDRVDYAVVIKGHSKTAVTLTRQDRQNIYHTSAYGPEGWHEGLQYFIAQN